MQSTFTVGAGGMLPHGEVVVTGLRLHVAGYYGGGGGRTITAGVWSAGGGSLSQVAAVLPAAGGEDSPLSPTINIPDVKLGAGTYRIGWSRTNANAIQWDSDTSAPGFTYYADGAAIGGRSLLWAVDYYIWV